MSDYIGRITKDGILEKGKETRSIYEYGNSALVYSLSGDLIARLQKYFPDRWSDLYALSVVRLMDPVPLKLVKDVWEKLYVSREIQAHLSLHCFSQFWTIYEKNYDTVPAVSPPFRFFIFLFLLNILAFSIFDSLILINSSGFPM